jgi:nifR3 family TIM-barrel protein
MPISLVKPLKLGNQTFPVNLIQGPLAGVSCAPFRLLTHEYGKPAFSCTEMISCKTLIHQPYRSQRRFTEKDPGEGPVCFQLSSADPHELAEAVKQVTDYGADLIDLNCGCPVKKIRKKGVGSGLLTNPSHVYALITAMKQNTHVPVSIKIRVEGGSNDKFNAEIARAVADAGADFLIVHGRHWTEKYDTPCHYDDIQFFVEALNLPVIGNGDISDIISLKKMFETGCAGVMIARAGVGQPWLIQKLIAEMNGEAFLQPSFTEVGQIFLRHVRGLVALFEAEKFAILQARSFAKYYARGLKDREKFCIAMNGCKSYSELALITQKFFSIH